MVLWCLTQTFSSSLSTLARLFCSLSLALHFPKFELCYYHAHFLVLLLEFFDYCWSFSWSCGVQPRPLLISQYFSQTSLLSILGLAFSQVWTLLLPCSSFDLDAKALVHVWIGLTTRALDGGVVFDLQHLLIMIRPHVILFVQVSVLSCSSFGLLDLFMFIPNLHKARAFVHPLI